MDLFELKKLVSLATRLIPAALFLIILAVIFWNRTPRFSRALVGVVAVLLLTLSSPVVSSYVISKLESQYEELYSPPAGTEYIAIMTGGLHRETSRKPNVILSPVQLARLTEAVRLWRLAPNAKLITTSVSYGLKVSTAEATAEFATWLGVPDDSIIRIHTTQDTEGEIREIAKIVGDEPLVITSSAYHLPRIARLASEHKLSATLAPSEWLVSKSRWWQFRAHHLSNVDKIIHEYVGMSWYRLKAVLSKHRSQTNTPG